jgi:two-component sensor histidine kinase
MTHGGPPPGFAGFPGMPGSPPGMPGSPPPGAPGGPRPPVEGIEVLNHLGRELSLCTGARSGYPVVARKLRETLGFARASLWSIDRRHGLLVKEAMDSADAPDAEELRIDEKLTHWQIRCRTRLVAPAPGDGGRVFPLPAGYRWHVLSLPVCSGPELLAVLNLYSDRDGQWYFDPTRAAESAEFFLSVAGMMELFIRTKALEANTTFYKEIHHRVKNNLQTVASLLRMQLRRLDRQSAARALEDSIGRIESIALVHETLSQGEIGLVDLGELLGRIAHLARDASETAPPLTLRFDGPKVMLTSKQATSLALIANELVQNALQHGVAAGGTRVDVAVDRADGHVRLVVEDDGAGLPADFDPVRDGNLGLTIVATLTADELSGEFSLRRAAGRTCASVTFPAGVAGLLDATAAEPADPEPASPEPTTAEEPVPAGALAGLSSRP